MSPDHAVSELIEIKNIAKINGYPEHFVDRIHTKHLKKRKLRDILGNPKDKFEVLEKSGVYHSEKKSCKIHQKFVS
jgi:hypothetical protein